MPQEAAVSYKDRGSGLQERDQVTQVPQWWNETSTPFLPPVSHWGFPLGEPPRNQRHITQYLSLQGPRRKVGWAQRGKQQTQGFQAKPMRCAGLTLQGTQLKAHLWYLSLSLTKGISAPTPEHPIFHSPLREECWGNPSFCFCLTSRA